MQKLDIAIVLLVILGGLSCYRAGFTRSVWGIAAVSAGVFTANQLWYKLAPVFQRIIGNPGIAKWTSIITIAAGVSILVDALFERIQRIMEKGVLGWINSVMGSAFGVAVSVILISCALILLSRYGGDVFDETVASSHFVPALLEIGHQIFDFSRQALQKQMGKF